MTDARSLLLAWAKSEGLAALHNGQATDEQIVDDLLGWLGKRDLVIVERRTIYDDPEHGRSHRMWWEEVG